jgi:HEAT repeat protein
MVVKARDNYGHEQPCGLHRGSAQRRGSKRLIIVLAAGAVLLAAGLLALVITSVSVAMRTPGPSQTTSDGVGDIESEYMASLGDPNPDDRAFAAEALGRRAVSGEMDAKLVANALAKLLSDKEPRVRVAALHGLADCGPAAAFSVPAVLDRLQDPSQDVRLAALVVLKECGPAAEPAIPMLRKLCDDKDVGSAAVSVLGSVGPPAIPALVELLRHSDPGLRASAVRSLASMGPRAKSAEPELKALLNDKDQRVSWETARALKAIGP